LDQELYNSFEILWLLWVLYVHLLVGEMLEMGQDLMVGVCLIEVLVLWVGVWVDWCLMLLMHVELLENMRWYLGIGLMLYR